MKISLHSCWCTVLIVLLSSCGNQSTEASAGIINSIELKEKMERNDPLRLIDVRTPAEVAQGALPGAINIDFRSADFAEQISTLPKGEPYLVYCAKGIRSAAAIEKMKALGFTDLIDLEGGYNAWKSQFAIE
ncbi:MAG: rhodanese-like domain-containing protein [Saprospiraceae bacterium]|nr:rhodanese-like domain-containing protein [Saprospiraceae bacterium]